MQASHLLLRRLWQFDRHVLYGGYKNRYSFKHNGHKFTLATLSPKEVYINQVKLQQSSLGNSGSKAREKEESKETMREKNKYKSPMLSEKKRRNIKSEKKEMSERKEEVRKMTRGEKEKK